MTDASHFLKKEKPPRCARGVFRLASEAVSTMKHCGGCRLVKGLAAGEQQLVVQ